MTRWIRNLNFSTKLVVIAIAAMVPVVVLTVLFLSEKQRNINVAARELAGLQRYQGLEAMLLPLGMHEIWSTAAAAGEGVAEKLQAATADVNRAVSQQDGAGQEYGAPAGEDARRWNELKYSWNALAGSKPASTAEVIRMHSQLRQKILDYRAYIAATSGLVLDGDAEGSFIIDAAVMRIPSYESYLTEMRSRAASVGAAGKATIADVQEITRTEVLAQSALDDIDADIRHAVEGGATGDAMRAGAQQSLAQVKSAFDAFGLYVGQNVISGSISDPLDDVVKNASQLTAAIRSRSTPRFF